MDHWFEEDEEVYVHPRDPYPISEAKGIESHLYYYNERVDTYVDGELQERPQTRFSP